MEPVNWIFQQLDFIEDGLWTYLGIPGLIFLGLYFSLKSGFIQVRKFPTVLRNFLSFMGAQKQDSQGVHPLKTFFAAVGGCIGIGNIVAVCTAVKIGGPGAVFWLWVAGFLGMLIKYTEVYLGMKYRVRNEQGSYNGGPMYYLQRVGSGRWLPILVCVLLCIYGVEVFMFRVITESVVYNWGVPRLLVVSVLLPLVMVAGVGGVRRVGQVCTAIIPGFLVIFSMMSIWVLYQNLGVIPGVLADVLRGAFSSQAPVGAFTGASMMVAMSQGVRRACYTGDLGVGYASVIHSESSTKDPCKQASLAVFGIFLDTFVICTLTLLLVLVSGVWAQDIDSSLMLQHALQPYFPNMHLFMPVLIFLLGYSTMISFIVVGIKCSEFLWGPAGRKWYIVYGVVALLLFSYVEVHQAQTMMTVAGALLLMSNLYGFWALRKEVEFRMGGE